MDGWCFDDPRPMADGRPNEAVAKDAWHMKLLLMPLQVVNVPSSFMRSPLHARLMKETQRDDVFLDDGTRASSARDVGY